LAVPAPMSSSSALKFWLGLIVKAFDHDGVRRR
jgi:hypothetical protein